MTPWPPTAILNALRVAFNKGFDMSHVQMEERHQSVPIHDAPRRRDAMSPPGPFGGARTLVRTIGRAAMVQAYELGLMASVVTMASLHLVGGGTDPAFGALQRVQAHPAPSTRPVLLVHGFRGHEVKLVLRRANPSCQRLDSRRDHLHAVRNFGGAARRPARRRG